MDTVITVVGVSKECHLSLATSNKALETNLKTNKDQAIGRVQTISKVLRGNKDPEIRNNKVLGIKKVITINKDPETKDNKVLETNKVLGINKDLGINLRTDKDQAINRVLRGNKDPETNRDNA